jgi:hypothetical protein
MTHPLLRTFLGWMEVLKPAFTKPGFCNALIIMVGWIQTRGTHAVTQALVETQVAGRRHHEAFHRFFSRGTWDPDQLGKLLFEKILEWLVGHDVTIDLVIDDTMVRKQGREIFGLGSHLDPVRSSRGVQFLAFGHVWVVLSVIVHLPFSRRPWALPILFRLYRSKKEHRSNRGGKYFKKTELARQMLDTVLSWQSQAQFRVMLDCGYANSTVMRQLSSRINVIGAMRPDAVLTALPTDAERKTTGRRRKKGQVLPKPLAMVKSSTRWQKLSAFLYGQTRVVEVKTVDAQWYRGAGTQLLRVVVVRVTHGKLPVRVFFSTNPEMSVIEILEAYAGRWSTEVCFRDLKQLLGFGDSRARLKTSVERTAPFVGYTYTLLVLWFATQGTMTSSMATPPVRPWYRHKRGFCFADILRAAQRVMGTTDVLDLANDFNDLCESIGTPPQRPISGDSEAA